MSQIVTRKGGAADEKEKRTDSPVKDMKKKLAANAEKDKEKEKTDKTDTKVEKNGTEKEKPSDSKKVTEKRDKTPTKTEKKDKPSGSAEKKDKEQKVEENGDKSSKNNAQKPKQNGKHNGSDVTNGSPPDTNGTVSVNEDTIIIDSDNEREDELFPELTYDDDEDDTFENTTPEGPSRSFTRRSQVKATRTPETPRPSSDKQADNANEDSKESKILKLKDDAPERKLRSTDPKEKKAEKTVETPKKSAENDADSTKDAEQKENGVKSKLDIEVIVEEAVEVTEESRKPDTNYSKSRVKVSPYRRSGRLADQTNTSVMANYTGNNTTMEMDITETSSILEDSHDDSYLNSLRGIKGRRSYKNLGEMPIKKVNRSRVNVSIVSGSEVTSRPTAPVVGRKRKPEPEGEAGVADTITVTVSGGGSGGSGGRGGRGSGEGREVGGKRARLLDSLARSFPRLPGTRHTEIVGINTDLPHSAPVAASELIENPETLKQTDNKRCVIM